MCRCLGQLLSAFILFFYCGIVNVVDMLEKSMETFIVALLKTARGVEVVASFGLLSYCTRSLLSPWNLARRYSCLEGDVLVSQVASCAEGLRSLEKTWFVEHRLVEVWQLLEGGGGTEDTVTVGGGEDVESALDDVLDGGSSAGGGALPLRDLSEREIEESLNRLVKVFVNFAGVFECLRRECSQLGSGGGLQAVPRCLSAFIERAVLLDSATKLGKLCCPDETQLFGLRFVSALVASLDTFLLLEWRFGIRRRLLNAQLQNGLDEEVEVAEDGGLVIDEGLIERNRLLVKCSILGGANERLLPPRGICEHGTDPYPYAIVTALKSDQLEKYADKAKKADYCAWCADDLGAVPTTSKRPVSVSLVSVVMCSLKHLGSGQYKAEHAILLKCPRLQTKIRNVARMLPQLNKQTLEVGCLFSACLRALLGGKEVASSSPPSNVSSCLLPSWEEVGIDLILDYGRRVRALDATLPYNSRKHDLADLLWHAEKARKLGGGCGRSSQHADQGDGSAEEKHEDGGEAFRPFDWFVAVVYLLFNGSTAGAVHFLNGLQATPLAHYLWTPAAVEMPSSHHYTVCHLFELVFASELPQLYNTFRLAGYSPSLVILSGESNDLT
ncbi:Protein broad-minded [Taenia crassiceps]|uniref:Protein broad-minded n=1 Tax=Taenia crassiceps TaxID=6207 RepID=A0ABR4Q0M0_9CEST